MIFFKTVRWKNLLSYGETFTTINLNRSPSTVITGSNGSGKSTVCEAITFGLFGKPFRNIKKTALVNLKNQRGAIVEIEFEDQRANSNDHYMIRRGIKPDIFEIYKNGEMLNQNSTTKDYQAVLENQILRCNYSIFTQIVMIGEATHVSFMRSKAADRRSFVERVLNLNVFTHMNKMHSSVLSDLKEKIQEARSDIMICQNNIENKEREIAQLKIANKNNYERNNHRIENEIKEIFESKKQITDTIKYLNSQHQKVDETELTLLKIKLGKKQELLEQLKHKQNAAQEELEHSEENHVCNSCGQDIPESDRMAKKEKCEKKIKELSEAIFKLSYEIETIKTEVSKMNEDKVNNSAIRHKIDGLMTMLKDKQKSIERLEKSKNDKTYFDTTHILNAEQELAALLEQKETINKRREELADENEYNALIKNMLQDSGIKAMMIRRFIPIINQNINHNLAKLGFFGKFELDENFEETIKARGFDELSYNSYSEGEKLRIDLAVLMAWRDMAKMQGIINTNLMFFDEVIDASMDISGTDAFATMLRDMKDTNVFIISHSPDKISDKVRSQISFTKNNKGFSKMQVKELGAV